MMTQMTKQDPFLIPLLLNFPNGLFGFETNHDFMLVPPPPSLEAPIFYELVSQSEPFITLFVTPLTPPTIDTLDIEAACDFLSISPEVCRVFGIMSVENTAAGLSVSVNLKAPLFMDLSTHKVQQLILPHKKYSVISTLSPT